MAVLLGGLTTGVPGGTRVLAARTRVAVALGVALVMAVSVSPWSRQQLVVDAVPGGDPRTRTVPAAHTFDGVGARVEPADPSMTPAVSAAQARTRLSQDDLGRTLVAGLTPTSLLLVQYTNLFGARHEDGSETPSVPRQLAWFAEYDDVVETGGSRPGGRTPLPPKTWKCSYYLSLSAASGKVLDAFDFCH